MQQEQKSGEVAGYVRNDLSYTEKDFFAEEIENVFFETLLPKAKPIIVGIIYRPPNQSNFLQTLNKNFNKLDTPKKDLYIHNHAGCKSNTLVSGTGIIFSYAVNAYKNALRKKISKSRTF